MAYPDVSNAFSCLGHEAQEKITGMKGVITSVSFDLYGCVQILLHPGLDKEGLPSEQHYFDINRIEIIGDRVMEPPKFSNIPAANYEQGPAEKPRFYAK